MKNSIQATLMKLEKLICDKWPEHIDLRQGISAFEADRLFCERGICTENDLLNFYRQAFEYSEISEEDIIIPQVFPNISTLYLEKHFVVPYQWNESSVMLFTANPYMIQYHIEAFKRLFAMECTFQFVRYSWLERMIQQVYYKADKPTEDNDDELTLRQLAGDAKVVRLVNEMLTQAIEHEASDIHLESEETALKIRFRIDGILQEYLSLPISDFAAVASRIKLIGNLNIAESRLPQDGRTSFRIGNYDLDIRISTIPLIYGESIVLRLLNKDSMRFDLRELGMNDNLLIKFSSLVQRPHGIVLVVGPTGSGKTTTLYSVMQQLNNHHKKIITIEDPVEYQLAGLSQMQVSPKIGLTFASGLRHIVRQDPDVILVGEIRDRETADIAINAALTGHLVLSTLHTNDAAGAITRLLDMGVENFLVSSALAGVLSQRLIRKLCPDCKGKGFIDNRIRCRFCAGSGFKGRTGIYELLIINDKIRDAIMHNATSDELNAIAIKHGMIPLIENGKEKVATSISTLSELYNAAGGN